MRQSSSIQRKLITITSVGSLAAAIIAAAAFTYSDLKRFWEQTGAEMTALASVLGDQVAPALTLNDPKAASEVLGSLHNDRRIQAAFVYGADGTCFAVFAREPRRGCPVPLADGIHRRTGSVLVSRSVNADKERVGNIVLAGNLPSLLSVLQQYLRRAALIVGLMLLVDAILVAILQHRVALPILAIARTAQRIAQSSSFSERAAVSSKDEVGVLARSFNTMLDQIAQRDMDLARHRDRLEQEIERRAQVNRELLQAKEKAEVAVRLKSEFLANMSHEIRTPLNGVTGMITLALDRCADPEARQQLEIAKTSALSLTAILNDILDLSRMEAGKLKIESLPFDLPHLLHDCLWMFDHQVREKHLRLTLNVARDCPNKVLGDPVRLRQVLINLLGNAVKFTLQGEVHLAVSVPAPGLVAFEVRDTGIGISKEKLSLIFEAFTQADGSTTRRFGGSGLGLTITKRLIKLMGGQITAQSEPGVGSVFSVSLPMPVATEPVSEPPRAVPSVPASLNVLVAEDNVVNQRVAVGILRRQGWTVSVAGTGEQAVEAFLTERFDLILMDVQMPELDGLEASMRIRQIEQQRSLTKTPIIAVTAHASSTQHHDCLAHGMDAVVTKPIDIASLLEAIQHVLPVTESVQR